MTVQRAMQNRGCDLLDAPEGDAGPLLDGERVIGRLELEQGPLTSGCVAPGATPRSLHI